MISYSCAELLGRNQYQECRCHGHGNVENAMADVIQLLQRSKLTSIIENHDEVVVTLDTADNRRKK